MYIPGQGRAFEKKSFWELRYDILDICDILTFLKKILVLDFELGEKLWETILMIV